MDAVPSQDVSDLVTPLGHEVWWSAALAVLATIVLYAAWLFLPLTIFAPRRHHAEPLWPRVLCIILIAFINAANVASLVLLVEYLLKGGKAQGGPLILNSMQIWLTSVLVFALWYWELDRGGPGARRHPNPRDPDFLLPQMQLATSDKRYAAWLPSFVDYLYIALTNTTAFSPTDTLPLTSWAKLLIGVQSLASLLTGPSARIVEEYEVDTGTLRELRAHEEQAAKELGQWTEKQQTTGASGEPLTIRWLTTAEAEARQREAVTQRTQERALRLVRGA